ncbi:hypothetical protein N9Z42_00330, partial [bacterium]|nr:hypothetical protein [bacterium]
YASLSRYFGGNGKTCFQICFTRPEVQPLWMALYVICSQFALFDQFYEGWNNRNLFVWRNS